MKKLPEKINKQHAVDTEPQLPPNWGKVNIDGELVDFGTMKPATSDNKFLQSRLNSAYQKGQENGKKQGRKEVVQKVKEWLSSNTNLDESYMYNLNLLVFLNKIK